MLYPFLCVDNFFNDPDEIVEYSKKFKYESSQNYPGKRTESLHVLDMDFYLWVNDKILSVLYPNDHNNLYYRAGTHFQTVPSGLEHDGWVHYDDCEFTCIIYLNKNKNCGTSIFSPIQQHYRCDEQKGKSLYYQDPTSYLNVNSLKDEKKQNNDKFEESIIVKSKYNRMILFDGFMFHAADPFLDQHSTEDRLTLISFFFGVQFKAGERNLKYPISQMRRI